MKKFDTIIIGAGLAGLECAAILSKEGMSTLVLEQAEIPGGFFQSFKRRGTVIDSSVHYIGSLDKGQFMEGLFSYLGVMKRVSFARMDNNSFDIIYIGDKCYPMAMGHDNFVERLSEFFPSERENLQAYVESIKRTLQFSVESVREGTGFSKDSLDSATKPIDTAISSFTSNKQLIRVLKGNSIVYCGESGITPYYVHAMASNSYIESSWRINGGAYKITDALVDIIRDNAGEVLCSSEVKSILTLAGRVSGVELTSGEKLFSERVISTLHPTLTTAMLAPDSGIKESYRIRVGELKNSTSMFSLYMVLKPGCLKYINSNLHLQGERPLMISFQPPSGDSEYAEVVTIVTPMSYSEVSKWSDSKTGRRGEKYVEFKRLFSETLIKRAERAIPGLKSAIEFSYSASPLTFRDYVKTPNGSVYGIMKDYNKPLSTFLPVKTRVENLYLAGQSINLHGVMGVSFTSLLTCSEIIGTGFINKMGL